MLTRGSNRCRFDHDDNNRPAVSPANENSAVSTGDEFEAFTFAAQANVQADVNPQVPVSVGGFAINASLINVPILSAQFNIANAGDSRAVAVKVNNQTQGNEA
ncbi:hypothetical protein ACQCT6_09605 [Cytobacillus gottheilii]|uniref:Uncharacterized protein n=1 Tax=Cytobacillus gottheilii TaxID=859144 RepID=A0ABX8FH85_9BACI|nr:hypothetical protein [Cytobacillus gottheilii]QVY63372.1 hypothetical protein J1899_10110 [Cytobacillus gottheilii]